MLILTFKENEKILLGDKITIKVLEIRGKQIRLGIEAPEDVLILRENWQKKKGHKGAQEGGSRRNPGSTTRTPVRPYPAAPPACSTPCTHGPATRPWLLRKDQTDRPVVVTIMGVPAPGSLSSRAPVAS